MRGGLAPGLLASVGGLLTVLGALEITILLYPGWGVAADHHPNPFIITAWQLYKPFAQFVNAGGLAQASSQAS